MWHQQPELKSWLESKLLKTVIAIEAIQGDASVRQFARVITASGSWILMLAPVDKAFHQFLSLAEWLHAKGVCVPTICSVHLSHGWVLMTDFGHTMLYQALNGDTAERLYKKALSALTHFQTIQLDLSVHLPTMDKAYFKRQLDELFVNWFLNQYLDLSLTSSKRELFEQVLDEVLEKVIQQPYLLTHVDYHSRNLMLKTDENIGIIDFQDAAIGPMTYDLVSLFNDCYIAWPRKTIEAWIYPFYEQQLLNKTLTSVSFGTFMSWFDLTGLQRHLKNFGIFARLSLRDNKHGYLSSMPTLVNYVKQTLGRYPFLKPLERFFNEDILPVLDKQSLEAIR